MSRQKLRIKNTELDNLVSNLRGEIGEIVTTWAIMRHFLAQERRLASGDIAKDMKNQDLTFLDVLVHKLNDELVARLSELAERKVGRLNFHFASIKLGKLNDEAQAFENFIRRHKFDEKRNSDISHKELPEEWVKHRHRSIPYKIVLRGIAHAYSIMRKIDRVILGPSANYLWIEMRKRRYSFMNPPSSAYMILPHLYLSNQTRARIIAEEMAEGRYVWSEMVTKIDGHDTKISVCKQWGAIILDGKTIVLDRYPLQQVNEIKGVAMDKAEPIYEQKKITAKYRVADVTERKALLTPMVREHQLGEGAVTELVDIGINLDDALRQNLGQMKVGDVKELSLTVTVLSGYEIPPN